jgi:hypothetical protein
MLTWKNGNRILQSFREDLRIVRTLLKKGSDTSQNF